MARQHTKAVPVGKDPSDYPDVPFTQAEEDAADAGEAVIAKAKEDYAKVKYKDDRKKAYGDIGDQLDMRYRDLLNGTTTWKDHVAKVKSDHPKPG